MSEALTEDKSSPQPKFRLTLLKATDQYNSAYSKSIRRINGEIKSSPLPFPKDNSFTIKDHSDFNSLYETYKKLLSSPRITQVLGSPTKKAYVVREEFPNKVSRTSENFSHHPDTNSSHMSLIDYIVLDIDDIPPEFLIPEFSEAYIEQNLTTGIIKSQAYSILSKFISTTDSIPPIIVRLSSSFGTKPNPTFRAHIILPLTTAIPITDIASYVFPYAGKRMIDNSFYRNSTQPVYSSGPQVLSPEFDPLSSSNHSIPRIYLFNSKNSYVDPLAPDGIYARLSDMPASQRQSHAPTTFDSREKKAANDLPELVGVFNRASETTDEYSYARVLEHLGYTPQGPGRWLSPQSSSGQPGLKVFTDGFIRDFHTPSPLDEWAEDHNPRTYLVNKSIPRRYSAYDLHYIKALSEDKLNTFKTRLLSLAAEDLVYQDYWYREITARTTYIVEGMPADQIDDIVEGLLSDMMRAKLGGIKRNEIEELIQKKVKESGHSLTKSDIHRTKTKIHSELNQNYQDLANDQTDSLNSHNLLTLINHSVLKDRKGKVKSYVIQSRDGNSLDIITSKEELAKRLSSFMPILSSEPLGWSNNKRKSTVEFAVNEIETSLAPKHKIRINHHLFQFLKSHRKEEDKVLKTVDFRTRAINPSDLRTASIHRLPFTKEEYFRTLKRYENTPFEETEWGKILSDTFFDEHDEETAQQKIEYLRDFMTYIFTPVRQHQVILALVGRPRSGKSTIKNILLEFFPEYTIERDARTIGGEKTAFHDLTEFTRLIVVNEFNAQSMKAHVLGPTVEILKQMSGRDGVSTRAMRENQSSIQTDALPLIISNDLPSIKDQAFQRRLRMIKFNKSFDTDNLEFENRWKRDLPYIFHWVMTNPKLKHIKLLSNSLPYSPREFPTLTIGLKPPKGIIVRESNQMNIMMDPRFGFISRYIVPAKGKSILKNDITHFFSAYHDKILGFRPDSDENNKQSKGMMISIQDFREIAEVKNCNANKSTRRLSPETSGSRAIKGIDWKNSDQMLEELSEFTDYTIEVE